LKTQNKFIIFTYVILFSAICKNLKAQQLIGISLGSSEMYKIGNLGESISYEKFKGNSINLIYQIIYKRIGVEVNLFQSSLKVVPQNESESIVSRYSIIENYHADNINTKGVSFNGLIFVIPKAIYVKVGYHLINTSYVNGTFLIKTTQNLFSNPPTFTYNEESISSEQSNGDGLTFGPGFIFKVFKHLYLNGHLDYNFTTFNQKGTLVSNLITYNTSQEIKFSYLNFGLGLSYSLNK
jgi:hypothetical protein